MVHSTTLQDRFTILFNRMIDDVDGEYFIDEVNACMDDAMSYGWEPDEIMMTSAKFGQSLPTEEAMFEYLPLHQLMSRKLFV